MKKLEGTGFVTKSGDHSQLSGNTKLSEVFSQDELMAMFGSHHQRGGRLTVQQLMDQRSGIRSQQESDDDKNLDRQVGDLSVDELGEPTTSELLRACEAGLNLGFKFPETSGDCPFNYTNFNATLTGAVLERVCGKPFQEIMQETLFNPLGMTETGYSTPLEEQRASSFKNGVVSKNDFLRNGDLNGNLYENLIEVGILKKVNEKEAKLTKSVDALIIECAKNSIEVPDSILDIMRQAQNGGLHAWEQEEYNDSHFFDASSHIWTSAHDLTLLFQHLRTDATFTEYFQTLMETDQSQNYHAFAKTRVEDGVFSFGHDGGRDDFGSAVHMDSEGRVMIWLENANVAEVDGSSQLATGLLEMTPFHGDPTRIHTSQVSKVAQQLASKKQFNGAVTVFKSGQLVEQSVHASEEVGGVDQTTLFRIGSSTKMFTSIAIMKLVEDGDLDLDTPIKDIFVDRDCPGQFGNITVRQLLTHSSGLSGAFDDKSDLSQDEIFSNIVRSFQEDHQDGPCYSNSGFYLLGMVIEKLSDQSYSEFMHDTFFEPVGMSRSFCDTRTRAELMQARKEDGPNPLHYHINFGDRVVKDDVHVSAKNISSAGNILSTPYDMAVFMQSMLDQLAERPSAFPVSRETLLTMMGDSGVASSLGLNRGLGLVRLNVSDRVVVGHPGIQEGFGCEFFVDPNSKDEFIVMNNLGIYGVDDSGSLVKEGAPAQPVGAYLGKQVFQEEG